MKPNDLLDSMNHLDASFIEDAEYAPTTAKTAPIRRKIKLIPIAAVIALLLAGTAVGVAVKLKSGENAIPKDEYKTYPDEITVTIPGKGEVVLYAGAEPLTVTDPFGDTRTYGADGASKGEMTARDVDDPVSLEGFDPVYHDEKGNRYRVDAPYIIYGEMIADVRTTPDQGKKSIDELRQIAESFMRELYEIPNDAELVEYGSSSTRTDFHLYVRENGFWRDTCYEISIRTDGLIVSWSKYVVPDDIRIPELDPSLLEGLTREKLEDLMKEALIVDHCADENTADAYEFVDAIVFYHAPKEQYAVSFIAHDNRKDKNVRCGAYLLEDEKMIPFYAAPSDD